MKRKMICLLMSLLLLFTFPVTAMAEDDNGIPKKTDLPNEADKYEALKDLTDLSDSSDLYNSAAADLIDGDWTYYVNVNGTPGDTDDDFVVITGYTGTSATVTTPTDLGGVPVTVINKYTFYENNTITSVTVSGGVKEIYGFIYCKALQSVSLPSSLVKIGDGCFSGSGLTSITIPASVSYIGIFAIDECNSMTAINVDPANTTFKSVDGVLFNKTGTELLMYPKARSYTSYTVPDGVQKIGTDAFYGAHLTQVALPNSLVTIGVYAFDTNDFVSVTIPPSVQNIGQMAFIRNDALVKFIVTNNSTTYDYDDIDNEDPGYLFSYSDVVMYGNAGSTTQIYADTYGYLFSTIPSSVSLNRASGTMINGTMASLAATTTPRGGYVTWSSSNEAIATVDAYGIISAKTTGTVTITATCLDKSASCTVTVIPLVPVGISCTKTDATAYGTATGSVTITASGGNTGLYEYSINNGSSWQSSNVFSGLLAGAYTAVVRDAYNENNTASCSVSINQPAYMGNVPANKIPAKVNAGNGMTVTPPAPPKGYTVQSITYASSNPSIATVDASGNVTFLAGGKVTITTKVVSQTVDKKGKIKTKTTTVKKTIAVKQPVSSITLPIASATIARTKKISLPYVIQPATASDKKLIWKSSNPKVATVNAKGQVTGKAGGTAVITCTAKDGSGATASCTINVTPIYPTGIKLSKAALSLKTGKSGSLKATVAPKNTDFKTVTWASSNPGVVTVDAKGKLKAIAPGTAVITATTSSGQIASCTVTVK